MVEMNNTLVLSTVIMMIAIAGFMALPAVQGFEDSKKDNDQGGGNDKKDSPSDDNSGGGNDPPNNKNHRGNN